MEEMRGALDLRAEVLLQVHTKGGLDERDLNLSKELKALSYKVVTYKY